MAEQNSDLTAAGHPRLKLTYSLSRACSIKVWLGMVPESSLCSLAQGVKNIPHIGFAVAPHLQHSSLEKNTALTQML